MPHLSKRARLDIPAHVLVEIASEPGKYKQMLDELSKRKVAAEAAEATAREAERKAGIAMDRASQTMAAHSERITRDDERLAGERVTLNKRTDELQQVANDLDQREIAVRGWEDDLRARQKETVALTDSLTDQAATLSAKEAQLDEREGNLDAHHQAIATREAKFADRLRQFNEDL